MPACGDLASDLPHGTAHGTASRVANCLVPQYAQPLMARWPAAAAIDASVLAAADDDLPQE